MTMTDTGLKVTTLELPGSLARDLFGTTKRGSGIRAFVSRDTGRSVVLHGVLLDSVDGMARFTATDSYGLARVLTEVAYEGEPMILSADLLEAVSAMLTKSTETLSVSFGPTQGVATVSDGANTSTVYGGVTEGEFPNVDSLLAGSYTPVRARFDGAKLKNLFGSFPGNWVYRGNKDDKPMTPALWTVGGEGYDVVAVLMPRSGDDIPTTYVVE